MNDPPTPFDELALLLTPQRLLHDARATGAGVRIAVVDSGIDRTLLQSRFPGMAVIEGAVFRTESKVPLEYTGRPSSPHGTTVADIILRLAPQSTLFSADVFGTAGSADVDTLICAIHHAIDVWNCKIINLSLGVPEGRMQPTQKRLQLQKTIEEAYYKDVLVVAAAHNEHPLTRSFPAAFAPPLLSVDKGLFANPLDFAYALRETVEFQAHGRGYLGPFSQEPATSWATPHLTGIAARVLSLKHDLKPFEMKAILYWMFQSGRGTSYTSPGQN